MPRRSFRCAALLAWRNLTQSRLRLISSVAGTAFAVTLMFLENGFRDALLNSMTAVIRHLDGELVIISKRLYTLGVPMPFPARRLDLAAGFASVERVSPFYVETRRARFRASKDELPHRIRVLAYRPRDEVLSLADARDSMSSWSGPETALADARSKPGVYGPIVRGSITELNNKRIRVVGNFSLGADFQIDGTLIMSEDNFLHYFPDRRGHGSEDLAIDIGVVRLVPGASIGQAKDQLAALMPEDVEVLTRDQFVAKEQTFWDRVMPVGVVFNIGVVMGLVVGLAICYQVLYADVADHLPEFAMLKAVGHGNSWLMLVVVLEGAFLAVLGFVVGLSVSEGVFILVRDSTGLPMRLSEQACLIVLGLTIAMCVLSALMAARQLTRADPATLFR